MAESRYRTSGPAVVSDTVDNETIIVDLDSGTYYDLNHVGAAIWGLLVRGSTAAEVSADLVSRFGAEPQVAQRDVDGLLALLLEEGLLVALDGAEPPAAPVPHSGNPANGDVSPGLPYEAPVVNRHSDMQELLLLDPVHEVDETGWPSRR